MKISSETKQALSVIFLYMALLSFLIGMAARFKMSFQSRAEISATAFTVAAILAGLGVIAFLFSLRKQQS